MWWRNLRAGQDQMHCWESNEWLFWCVPEILEDVRLETGHCSCQQTICGCRCLAAAWWTLVHSSIAPRKLYHPNFWTWPITNPLDVIYNTSYWIRSGYVLEDHEIGLNSSVWSTTHSNHHCLSFTSKLSICVFYHFISAKAERVPKIDIYDRMWLTGIFNIFFIPQPSD